MTGGKVAQWLTNASTPSINNRAGYGKQQALAATIGGTILTQALRHLQTNKKRTTCCYWEFFSIKCKKTSHGVTHVRGQSAKSVAMP